MQHTRHSSIFDASHTNITFVGGGGIGATACLGLGKMGVCSLIVYDGDTVGEENLATQLHRPADLGREKVLGIEYTLREFCGDDTQIYPESQRVTADMKLFGDIIISGVDSIKARQDIWQAVKNGSAGWYIDARMAAEEFQGYCVDLSNPEKVGQYDQMIMSETDAGIPDVPCTSKATFFTSLIAGGEIGSLVRMIITGVTPPYYYVYNIIRKRLIVAERY